jgi:hypothetical protein
MEIDMAPLTKPIPDHTFHQYSDDLLKSLIKFWRTDMELATLDTEIPSGIHQILIENAYKVLGYRCAIQYLEMYGD